MKKVGFLVAFFLLAGASNVQAEEPLVFLYNNSVGFENLYPDGSNVEVKAFLVGRVTSRTQLSSVVQKPRPERPPVLDLPNGWDGDFFVASLHRQVVKNDDPSGEQAVGLAVVTGEGMSLAATHIYLRNTGPNGLFHRRITSVNSERIDGKTILTVRGKFDWTLLPFWVGDPDHPETGFVGKAKGGFDPEGAMLKVELPDRLIQGGGQALAVIVVDQTTHESMVGRVILDPVSRIQSDRPAPINDSRY